MNAEDRNNWFAFLDLLGELGLPNNHPFEPNKPLPHREEMIDRGVNMAGKLCNTNAETRRAVTLDDRQRVCAEAISFYRNLNRADLALALAVLVDSRVTDKINDVERVLEGGQPLQVVTATFAVIRLAEAWRDGGEPAQSHEDLSAVLVKDFVPEALAMMLSVAIAQLAKGSQS